jgi:hypothetical protein
VSFISSKLELGTKFCPIATTLKNRIKMIVNLIVNSFAA